MGMQLIRKHFLAIFGYVAFFGPPVWKAVKPILQWLGDFDLIISRIEDPDWMGAVIRFIIDPPGWLIFTMMIAGVILIRWDSRRTRDAKQPTGDGFSATGIVGKRLPSRTWIQRVEPSHVIILGLGIALCGAIWQMRRVTPIDPRIAELQSQVNKLTQQPAAVSDHPESVKKPPSQYYTRLEIDGMLTSLGELQRLFKSKPIPSEAIELMTRRMTGALITPDISEYPSIADGLEKYAQQVKADDTEMRQIVKDADEFVRSAVLPESAIPFSVIDPLYKTLLQAAEVLRNVAHKTSDNSLAGAAIRDQQRQVLDEKMKYNASIQSMKQKIADKMTDLRSR